MVPTATSNAQRHLVGPHARPGAELAGDPAGADQGRGPARGGQRDASLRSTSARPTTSLKDRRRSDAWEHKVRFVACRSSRSIAGHRPRGQGSPGRSGRPALGTRLWAPGSGRPALGARPRLVTDPRVPPVRRGRRDHTRHLICGAVRAAKDTRTDRLVCRSLPARCQNHEALAASPPARRAWRPRGNRQPLAWHWLPTVRRILVHRGASHARGDHERPDGDIS